MKLINKTMRKLFTLLTVFIISFGFATDRFVDPNLSSGNGTTLFTTITSAVVAAQNGDRIIIASSTYNEAALTIGKSLQIMPQTQGTVINFNANITIAGFPGMKLEITGFNLGLYSFLSNSITNGVNTNRAIVHIIDSSAYNLDFNNDFYKLNCLSNNITHSVKFKFGSIVKSNMFGVFLFDEPSQSNETEKIFIAANNISTICAINNNNAAFAIANNYIKDLFIIKWNQSNAVKNKIINNEFTANAKLHFSSTQYSGTCYTDCYTYYPITYYNFIFSSNKFNSQPLFSQYNVGSTNQPKYSFDASLDYILYAYDDNYYNSYNNYMIMNQFYSDYGFGVSGPGWTSTSGWPNLNSPGFFQWTYNYYTIPFSNQTSTLTFTNVSGPNNDVDGGNPNHEYYDIDLTINDRGVNGGPYSVLNYNAANPNNSKAFIFDLEMPADLFPGQNVEIKAQGYHKN